MGTVPSPSPLCRFRRHHHRKRGEKLFKFLRGNRTPGSSHFLVRCVNKRTVSGHADNSKNRAAADPHTRRPNNNPQDAQQPQEQQQLNPTTNYFLLPVPSRDGGTAATPRGTLPTLSGILRLPLNSTAATWTQTHTSPNLSCRDEMKNDVVAAKPCQVDRSSPESIEKLFTQNHPLVIHHPCRENLTWMNHHPKLKFS
jgi:hypothetical protein